MLRPSTAVQENKRITDTNRKQLVFPKREGWDGVPRARAADTDRRSAGWAVRVLKEPVRRNPRARAWPGETRVCLRKMGSWHPVCLLLWGFSLPQWAAAPRPRAREFQQGLLMRAGEGVGKVWWDAWQVQGRPPASWLGPGSTEPAGV